MNFPLDVTACRRKEPLEALAGDRFREAMAATSAMTDSLELQLDVLGAGEGGSSFKESLGNKSAVILLTVTSDTS